MLFDWSKQSQHTNLSKGQYACPPSHYREGDPNPENGDPFVQES